MRTFYTSGCVTWRPVTTIKNKISSESLGVLQNHQGYSWTKLYSAKFELMQFHRAVCTCLHGDIYSVLHASITHRSVLPNLHCGRDLNETTERDHHAVLTVRWDLHSSSLELPPVVLPKHRVVFLSSKLRQPKSSKMQEAKLSHGPLQPQVIYLQKVLGFFFPLSFF